MIETKSTMIDGAKYDLTQIAPYPDGERIYRKLHKYIGPILEAIELAKASGRMAVAATALGELVADDGFKAMVEELLKTGGLRCQGHKVDNPAKHIAEAGYDRMYELWWFALRINYEAVFTKLLDRVGGLEKLDLSALQKLQAGSPGAAGP